MMQAIAPRPRRRIGAATLLIGLAVAGPEPARAAPYDTDVTLHGTPARSAKVSGYLGTPVELEADVTGHAIYGISSAERRDNPCWLWIGTEDVNDPGDQRGEIANRCGDLASSRTMKAAYRDDMYFGSRVFVTAVRVCTNNKETRIKGFQLRGRQIEADGGLATLTYPPGPVVVRLSGGDWDLSERDEHVDDAQNPADYRNNCKQWHAWAACPQPNQLATGVIGYFEAGKEPRSLTGIQLLCRNVALSHAGAVPK
jgi:hypothetical protein